jgi:hypothetical protein
LLGSYGILSGSDGNNYSSLLMITGISFIGIDILYPIWGLLLGRWILWKQEGRAVAGDAGSAAP